MDTKEIQDIDLSSLSLRGQEIAGGEARIDMKLFMEASENLYDPKENPKGSFPLNVAENRLMAYKVLEKFEKILHNNKIPEWVLQYTDPTGHPEVKEEVALFMERHLCKTPILPETIALSSGAAGIIETSSFLWSNPSDVVVIPAPAYPMYTKDLGTKSGMERYNLQTHFNLNEISVHGPVTIDHLEKARFNLIAEGKNFKMLLITSPDNPMGSVYTEKQLYDLAEWCISHRIHFVVNEIYGLSMLDLENPLVKKGIDTPKKPVSFAIVMHEIDSDYLHLWYALSKDFAMSGMRVGILHSLNKGLIQGMGNVNIPHMVSNLTQWLVGKMLKDDAFITQFITENTAKITESYTVVVDALKRLSLPYHPAYGSLFIWADFSTYLKEKDASGEEKLWLDIYKNTGILLTPGAGFGHEKKGMFRIVHTAIPTKHLKVAMDRMVAYLSHR